MKKVLSYVAVLIVCLTLVVSLSLVGCKTTQESAAATEASGAEEAAGSNELTPMIWISPEGELENTGDYVLWVASAMGYMEQFGIKLVMEPGPADSLATTNL